MYSEIHRMHPHKPRATPLHSLVLCYVELRNDVLCCLVLWLAVLSPVCCVAWNVLRALESCALAAVAFSALLCFVALCCEGSCAGLKLVCQTCYVREHRGVRRCHVMSANFFFCPDMSRCSVECCAMLCRTFCVNFHCSRGVGN